MASSGEAGEGWETVPRGSRRRPHYAAAATAATAAAAAGAAFGGASASGAPTVAAPASLSAAAAAKCWVTASLARASVAKVPHLVYPAPHPPPPPPLPPPPALHAATTGTAAARRSPPPTPLVEGGIKNIPDWFLAALEHSSHPAGTGTDTGTPHCSTLHLPPLRTSAPSGASARDDTPTARVEVDSTRSGASTSTTFGSEHAAFSVVASRAMDTGASATPHTAATPPTEHALPSLSASFADGSAYFLPAGSSTDNTAGVDAGRDAAGDTFVTPAPLPAAAGGAGCSGGIADSGEFGYPPPYAPASDYRYALPAGYMCNANANRNSVDYVYAGGFDGPPPYAHYSARGDGSAAGMPEPVPVPYLTAPMMHPGGIPPPYAPPYVALPISMAYAVPVPVPVPMPMPDATPAMHAEWPPAPPYHPPRDPRLRGGPHYGGHDGGVPADHREYRHPRPPYASRGGGGSSFRCAPHHPPAWHPSTAKPTKAERRAARVMAGLTAFLEARTVGDGSGEAKTNPAAVLAGALAGYSPEVVQRALESRRPQRALERMHLQDNRATAPGCADAGTRTPPGAVPYRDAPRARGDKGHVAPYATGASPLCDAVAARDAARVAAALEAGASPCERDSTGRCALLVAALAGQVALVEPLLLAGAAINERSGPWHFAALSAAAEAGDDAMVHALLAAGANVEVRDNQHCTPLLRAAFNGYTSIVSALLDAGARVNTAAYGSTALHRAASRGHTATVATLVASGANVRLVNKEGGMPLHCALASLVPDTVAALLFCARDAAIAERWLADATARGLAPPAHLGAVAAAIAAARGRFAAPLPAAYPPRDPSPPRAAAVGADAAAAPAP